jgi:hypothetical protein
MFQIKLLHIALISALAALTPPASHADDALPEVDIRSSDGKVIIAAEQIRSYDWETHTLTLTGGTRAVLAGRFFRRQGIAPGLTLATGIPFSVCVGGKPIYYGNFTTTASSKSFFTPIILVHVPSPQNSVDQLHIQFGYPTQDFAKGKDPRSDGRIRGALQAAGKLVAQREDRINWVAASLQEMQTITAGMTRGELLEVFFEEPGGVSNRFQRRYAYRDCPYIKVDVKFKVVENSAEKIKELPTDEIIHISKPFLEWSITD